jgi:hypothetical protein
MRGSKAITFRKSQKRKGNMRINIHNYLKENQCRRRKKQVIKRNNLLKSLQWNTVFKKHQTLSKSFVKNTKNMQNKIQ